MIEIGRVLKSGGRCVITFPFVHGPWLSHLEEWQAGKYSQRHYDQHSVKERLIIPSNMRFISAKHFGEIFQIIGRIWIKMPQFFKNRFGFVYSLLGSLFWKVCLSHNGDEFELDPKIDLRKAGGIVLVLKKE